VPTTPDRGAVWPADLGIAAKVQPGLAMSVPPSPQDRVLVTRVSLPRTPGAPRLGFVFA
jgi:hypothetical protein